MFLFLIRAVLIPKDAIISENRYATKLEIPSMNTYLNGKFQDNTEKALMDQILFSQTMKSTYFKAESRITYFVLKSLSDKFSNKYVKFMNTYLFNTENIVYRLGLKNGFVKKFDKKISSLNNTIVKYPDIDFYTYYIEKDTDIDFDKLIY